jgi:adenylate cyclase
VSEGRDADESATLEIERKFLLDQMPALPNDAEVWKIEQGYLDHGMGRLRRTMMPDGSVVCTHTIKRGRGITKTEIEREITATEFQEQWPHTEWRRLRKTRYRIRDESLIWEIDAFADLDLVLAEVELPAADAPVRIPPWLQPHIVREVTDDPEFTNAQIARRIERRV